MTDVAKAPFNQTVGIFRVDQEGKKQLRLKLDESVKNFFDSIHPSAQLALAEASAGQYLVDELGVSLETMVPNLRKFDAQIKKSALSDIYAASTVETDASAVFFANINNRKSSSITVNTKIFDTIGNTCMIVNSDWLIQIRKI